MGLALRGGEGNLPGPIRAHGRSVLPARNAHLAQVEQAMASSTNAMGNLDHPRLLSEPIDLAQQDVRTGSAPSPSGPAAARFHAPAKASDLPCDLQTLLKCRLFTVKHVPAGCQERVTTVLAGTIAAYCKDPCEKRLFGLLAFPKLVQKVATLRSTCLRPWSSVCNCSAWVTTSNCGTRLCAKMQMQTPSALQ